jgi:hypothetical protein
MKYIQLNKNLDNKFEKVFYMALGKPNGRNMGETIVDDEDYYLLNYFSWHLTSHGCYVCTTINNKKIRMHRLIMSCQKDKEIDHINGNSLDNRKCNLRIVDRQQNNYNKRKMKNNTSGYKGVTYNKLNKKWLAQIQFNKQKIHIGLYDTVENAAIAYNIAAKEVFGEFACLNQIKFSIN